MKTPSLPQLVKGAFVALIAFTLGSTAAQAQATRTWVSGVGDDANPCSRTAPCKTFAGAISKTAAKGEINVLDPGGFGAVTITKAITIDGSGGSIAGVLTNAANAINVSAGINDLVNLRNLDINGLDTANDGIKINSGAEVNIENCVIYQFAGKGVEIAKAGGKMKVNIKNSIIRKCAGGAVHAIPTGGADVAVSISYSSLNSSQFGFRADNNVGAVLTDCVVSGNVGNGILSLPSSLPTVVNVTRCTVNNNGTPPASPAGVGILSVGALSTIIISNNAVSDNATGIATQTGGFMISTGNNNVIGNTTNATAAPTSTPGGL